MSKARKLIKNETIRAVEKMIDEGVSDKVAALEVGVSPSTVRNIRFGVTVVGPERDSPDSPDPGTKKVRCGGCGGMVLMPCHTCRTRLVVGRRAVRSFASGNDL